MHVWKWLWTPAELEKLNQAISLKDKKTIDYYMSLYHQRNTIPELKNAPHIVVAAYDGKLDLFDYCLATSTYDKKTLYQCVQAAIMFNHLEIVKRLFLTRNLELDPNYTFTKNSSPMPIPRDVQFKLNLLSWAIAQKQTNGYQIIEFLLGLPNIDVNKGDIENAEDISPLLAQAMAKKWDVKLINLLIQYGADIAQDLVSSEGKINFVGILKVRLARNPDDKDANEILAYLQEVGLISVTKEDSSPEHTSGSGSNSPASAGSLQGSPKHPSMMGRHSPPGSPMQRSDSSSSGSAGSSPEKVSSVRDSAKEKAAELLRAANNDVDVALFNAIKEKDEENDLALQKTLVDTGNLKFTEIGNSSVLFVVVTHGQLELLKYIFSKYPTVDVHKTVKFNQRVLNLTLLHGAALSTHINSLEIMRFLLDKKIDANVPDAKNTRPLHLIAVSPNAYKKVEELVSRGANPLLTNDQDYIPYSTIGTKCGCDGENPDAILLEQTIKNVTEQAELKQRARHIDSSQSKIISTPAEIQYKPASSKPIVEERVSYGSSSSVMFPKSSQANASPHVPPPVSVTHPSSRSGTTMYAPLPPSSAQLPKQPERVVQQEAKEKKSNSIGSKLKKLFS